MYNKKKVRQLGLIGLMIAGIILIFISMLTSLGFLVIGEPTNYEYHGKEIFQTTEAYQDFKAKMSMEEVDIQDVQTLNSELPIVVQFVVYAPNGLDFPYGQKTPLTAEIIHLGYLFIGTALLLTSFIFFLKEKEEE
jgi:hypothetical protein